MNTKTRPQNSPLEGRLLMMIKRLVFFIVLASVGTSCTVYRSICYWTPDIDEYKAFPQEKINSGEDKFYFPVAIDSSMSKAKIRKVVKGDTLRFSVDEYLAKSATTAFLIIKNDTIVFEKYYRGYDRSKISTFFSVTKSVTSLLVGIAVDEGFIKSVHDPVTDYIPELKKEDPLFQKLTIEHLLNMQAGFKFNESYSNPFSGMARLFYGRNQFGYLKNMKFVQEPGEENDYNSATTALLGIVLERATTKRYAEYLQEKVWKPLEMEYDASISLDDKKHRSAKSYQGLNATAIDLAKIGRLYLNDGMWNGKRIVSEKWVAESSTPCIEENHIGYKYKGYQYHWYSDKSAWYSRDSTGNYRFKDSLSALQFAEKSAFNYYKLWKERDAGQQAYHWDVTVYAPQYEAFGILGQTLYIDPEKKLIMVRLGEADYFDYSVVSLMKLLTRNYPVIEKKW